MKKATSITITRAEGPSHACGVAHVCNGPDPWAEAREVLLLMSYTAQGGPGQLDMGVDKTDFTVVWEDGEDYSGTFGLRYDDIDLPRHIREVIEGAIEHHQVYDIDPVAYQAFLDTHEIGRAPSVSERIDLIQASGWPIAYDGCHKLYFLQDAGRIAEAREIGYDIYPSTDLRELFEDSCGLRFVSRWGHDNADFDHQWNISQSEEWD